NTALFNSDYVASYRNIDNYFFNMLQRRRQIWGYSIYTLDGEVLRAVMSRVFQIFTKKLRPPRDFSLMGV
ncbi:MAG: hypothetical protein FWG72_10070, partial [Oscillospiraceae bacterium]|nr:hypothetical protein [Oscillospiraceae bacterium]